MGDGMQAGTLPASVQAPTSMCRRLTPRQVPHSTAPAALQRQPHLEGIAALAGLGALSHSRPQQLQDRVVGRHAARRRRWRAARILSCRHSSCRQLLCLCYCCRQLLAACCRRLCRAGFRQRRLRQPPPRRRRQRWRRRHPIAFPQLKLGCRSGIGAALAASAPAAAAGVRLCWWLRREGQPGAPAAARRLGGRVSARRRRLRRRAAVAFLQRLLCCRLFGV